VDVQVSCNRVERSKRAVEIHQYTPDVSGPAVRFRENRWDVLTSGNDYRVLGTNSLAGAALGPSASGTGDNRLAVHPLNKLTKFIVETDSLSGSLDATQNYWYTDDDTTRTLLTSPLPISQRIVRDPAGSVNYSSFRTQNDPDPSCLPERPAGAPDPPGSVAKVGLAEAEVEGGGRARSASMTIPKVASLGGPVPNPAKEGVELMLAVPPDQTGRYAIEVFDVRGRKVFASSKEIGPAGWYPIAWSGKDSHGRWVGAGNYFLRVKGPGFTKTRRVTIVR
jgi:hypothetical protein